MRSVFIVTLNETRKGVLVLWAYKVNMLFNLIAMTITFVGVSFIINDGKLDPQRMASTLLGYLIWYYVLLVTGDMGENLEDELQEGTVEQMFISPVPFNFILLGRSFATLIISSLQILLIAGSLIIVMKIPLQWRWEAVPVIFITIAGLFGLGFVLAGLTLIFKQIHSAISVVDNVLIFLNGALVPIAQFPAWLVVIADILPSTLGITVLRSILLNSKSLGDVWNDGSLPLLIIHSTVYFIAGWILLQRCTQVVKRQGTLGQY